MTSQADMLSSTVMPFFPSDTGGGQNVEDDEDSQRMGNNEGVPLSSRIRVKNRRKRYLDLHPEYFCSADLELADPLLYDRLIRRFQTTAEREAEGRRKGYSGTLEADLLRSEAKLDALANPDLNQTFSYRRGAHGEILEEEQDDVPRDKEEGYARWKWEMEIRFLRGGDTDFDYETVDDGEEYDDRGIEEQEAEDRWFDEEEASFVKGDLGRSKSRELQGETGVQDF